MRRPAVIDPGLAGAPDAVFQVWNNRLKIELEAAHLFFQMARDLGTLYGSEDEVAKLSLTASEDELRHADMCREILSHSEKALEPLPPFFQSQLGPLTEIRDRLLYSCVAVGCVTETLSTALLIEMKKKAAPGIVKYTIHEILVDEVSHGRIGWAELARAARSRDLAWMSEFIPAMIEEAIGSDIRPMVNTTQSDLSRWGILPSVDARKIMEETIQEVVIPGLAEYGIQAQAGYPRVSTSSSEGLGFNSGFR